MSDIQTPSLHEMVQMKKDFGLEGEDDTFLVVLLASEGGGFLVMKGPSRSGKDYTVEATDYCRNEGRTAFIPESSSKTALFEKNQELNRASIHIYPDMGTELPEHLLKQIKRHGEGRSITHSYTDVMGGREVVEQVIDPPEAFIMFLATDNQQLDLNDYPEIRNRALIVYTDGSQEQNDLVLDRQAQEEATYIEPIIPPERADEIRDYIDTLPTQRYNIADHMDSGVGDMKVPFAVPFREQDPLPSHFPEVRMDFKRLMKFMKIVSIWHHQDRMQPLIRGQPTLMVTPVDGWLTMRVFGEKMIMSSLNLEDLDMAMLAKMRESGNSYTVADLQSDMREKGYHVTDRDVRGALKSMRVKGYVRVDQSATPNEYGATAFAQIAKPEKTFDWQRIVDETVEFLRDDDSYDDDVTEEYISRFCEGDGLVATHPFTGEEVDITEWEGYSENMEEAIEEMEEVMDEPVYGSSSEDTDGKADETATASVDDSSGSDGLGAFTDGGESIAGDLM